MMVIIINHFHPILYRLDVGNHLIFNFFINKLYIGTELHAFLRSEKKNKVTIFIFIFSSLTYNF